MKILAVDPGQARHGIAISDPTGTLARRLTVIEHMSRAIDAATIASLADENHVDLILFGLSSDSEGNLTPEGKSAKRLAAAVRSQTDIPIEFWDESFSTQSALNAQIELGTSRRKRRGHLDDLAAAVILQSYLDAHIVNSSENES